jgi:hypothetical protein
MQNRYFDELLSQFPEVQDDRYGASFESKARASDAARTLTKLGVVMLRQALPVDVLSSCRRRFEHFTRSLSKETACGSWHLPWRVSDEDFCPMAVILTRLLRSWAWEVVEHLCGSTDIAVPLSFCVARHAIDARLGVGAHQDAKVLSAGLPFSLWIPPAGHHAAAYLWTGVSAAAARPCTANPAAQ